MLRRMNLALAILAMLMTAGLAAAQNKTNGSAEAQTLARVKPGMGDPCGPWFVGTVFVPCNTRVGALVWNEANARYEVSLDDRLTRQAYDHFVERYRQTRNPAARSVPAPDYSRFLDQLRDLFSGLHRRVVAENPKGPGGNERKFPGHIELSLDVRDGKLGGGLTWSWP